MSLTKRRREEGCLTACVAYYFNQHPERVPLFIHPVKGWKRRFRSYWRRRGYVARWERRESVPRRGTFIVVGPSLIHKDSTHAVVYRNGRMIYDPHYPSQWTNRRVTHVLRVEWRKS